jgi:PAS domain S-box-containing protein
MGDGEMAERIRTFDWSATAMGPLDAWPDRLRGAVDNMLASGFPSYVWWGPELIQLYNDAALSIVRAKHPALLGAHARHGWADVWDDIAPLVDRVFSSGRAEVGEDLPLVLERGGERETAYFTFSYSALRDESGAVAGLLKTAIETTQRVLAERALRESEERQAFLLKLSDALRPLGDPVQIQNEAARILGERLGADRTLYAQIDAAREVGVIECGYVRGDAPSLAGEHAFAAFLPFVEAYRAGRSLIVDDVETAASIPTPDLPAYRAFALRALVGVPLIKHGEVVASMCALKATPHAWTKQEISLVEETAERTWAAVERARAETELRESAARLEAATEVDGLACYSWDPARDVMHWDARIKALWGLPPDAEIDYALWLSAIHPDDRARIEAAVAHALDPDGDGVCQSEYRVIGIGDGVERWVSSHGRTVFEGRRPLSFVGAARDITKRRERGDRLHVLVGELQHRTRNLLGLVRATADKTLKSSRDLDDFSARFHDRLDALARVQGLLSRLNAGDRVTFDELIQCELAAMAADPARVTLEGPVGERLRSSTVGPGHGLARAGHQCGQVRSAGPAARPSDRDLGAAPAVGGRGGAAPDDRLARDGRRRAAAHVRRPRRRAGPGADRAGPALPASGQDQLPPDRRRRALHDRGAGLRHDAPGALNVGQSTLHQRRLLVVEDEYMLADELQRELTRVGAVVLGPVPSVGMALELLAREAELDGAVLDVNLGGELVYPVADALTERAIPFVFVTGYDACVLPPRFAQAPRCGKPVKLDCIREALGLPSPLAGEG